MAFGLGSIDRPDATSRAASQHAGDAPGVRRRRIRLPRVRSLLATSGFLAAGVSFAVLAAGVSFAFVNSSSPVNSGGTVTAGTSGLNLQYGSGAAAAAITIPASVYQNMLPGDVIGVQVNVINTGDVPQLIGASISATSAWQTRVATGTCPATVLGSAALTTTSAGAVPLAIGATQSFCVQVTLPASAPLASENSSVTYTVNFAGTQTTP